MYHINDINAGDVYFSSSDIGWVVGHSFIIYGPFLRGATTVLFEVILFIICLRYLILFIKGKTKYSRCWNLLENS